MALGIITEWLARVEYKIDLILTHLKVPKPLAPMHFIGTHNCPVCSQMVEYIVDITNNVVARKCACKTGKQPALIPLLPVNSETPNGNPAPASFPVAEEPPGLGNAEDRHRR